MLDKTRLGGRYTCFQCGTKFYDLNRPAAICPECGADQENAPVEDIKALLSKNGVGRGRKAKAPAPEEEEPAAVAEEGEEEEEDSDDEEIGLLGDDDDLE